MFGPDTKAVDCQYITFSYFVHFNWTHYYVFRAFNFIHNTNSETFSFPLLLFNFALCLLTAFCGHPSFPSSSSSVVFFVHSRFPSMILFSPGPLLLALPPCSSLFRLSSGSFYTFLHHFLSPSLRSVPADRQYMS